jgi:hypothetical protein
MRHAGGGEDDTPAGRKELDGGAHEEEVREDICPEYTQDLLGSVVCNRQSTRPELRRRPTCIADQDVKATESTCGFAGEEVAESFVREVSRDTFDGEAFGGDEVG